MLLFSELEGFVIYDPACLTTYISDNNLSDENLLSLFTETDAGDFVSQQGIIIPIIGIEPDYYSFDILTDLPLENTHYESKGWILQVISNQVTIVGIGYLVNPAKVTPEHSLSFTVPNGWYQVTIATARDALSNKQFLLQFERVSHQPVYRADMDIDYTW